MPVGRHVGMPAHEAGRSVGGQMCGQASGRTNVWAGQQTERIGERANEWAGVHCICSCIECVCVSSYAGGVHAGERVGTGLTPPLCEH